MVFCVINLIISNYLWQFQIEFKFKIFNVISRQIIFNDNLCRNRKCLLNNKTNREQKSFPIITYYIKYSQICAVHNTETH